MSASLGPSVPTNRSSCEMFSLSSISPLKNRNRSHVEYCSRCRISEKECAQKLMRCSRCNIVKYCSRECQRAIFGWHKEGCKSYSSDRQDPSRHSSTCEGDAIMEFAYDSCHTIEEGKHMFELALDKYIESYEHVAKLNRNRNSPAFQQEFSPLRSRIPILLAGLGHDDLAISEAANCMGASTTTDETVIITKYDDIIGTAWSRATNPLPFTAWTAPLLLPIVLVKMRVVKELRCDQRAFDQFSSTFSGLQLDQVASLINGFLVGEQGTSCSDFITQQERQLWLAVDALRLLASTGEDAILQILMNRVPLNAGDTQEDVNVFAGDNILELYLFLQDSFLQMETSTRDALRESRDRQRRNVSMSDYFEPT